MKNKPDSKRINKLLDTLGKINDENVVDREAIGFFSRLLLLCTLPHKNPGDDVNVYSRKTNNIHLGIQPGFNMKTQKSFGIPYGIYPRLLLAFITTEVKKKKSPKIKPLPVYLCRRSCARFLCNSFKLKLTKQNNDLRRTEVRSSVAILLPRLLH